MGGVGGTISGAPGCTTVAGEDQWVSRSGRRAHRAAAIPASENLRREASATAATSPLFEEQFTYLVRERCDVVRAWANSAQQLMAHCMLGGALRSRTARIPASGQCLRSDWLLVRVPPLGPGAAVVLQFGMHSAPTHIAASFNWKLFHALPGAGTVAMLPLQHPRGPKCPPFRTPGHSASASQHHGSSRPVLWCHRQQCGLRRPRAAPSSFWRDHPHHI